MSGDSHEGGKKGRRVGDKEEGGGRFWGREGGRAGDQEEEGRGVDRIGRIGADEQDSEPARFQGAAADSFTEGKSKLCGAPAPRSPAPRPPGPPALRPPGPPALQPPGPLSSSLQPQPSSRDSTDHDRHDLALGRDKTKARKSRPAGSRHVIGVPPSN